MSFNKWINDYEREIKPEFNKRLINGVIVPENLDSELLQHYLTYRTVRATWILVIITALMGLLSAIINLLK